MADYIIKRGDVGQQITRRLYEKRVTETLDLTTGVITPTVTYQQIPLVAGDTVKLLLKELTTVDPPVIGTATGGGSCSVNTTTSEVTYTLVTADVNQTRTWAMEHQVTKLSGEIITVPDEPDPERGRGTAYLTMQVIEDLGS